MRGRSIIPSLLLVSLAGCHLRPPAAPFPLAPSPAAPAQAPPDTAARPRAHTAEARPRFFKNLPYGSDAQFNPLSVVIDHGFDQLRTSKRRDITTYPFGSSFKAVLRSVVQPDRSIRRGGYRTWLRDEILPISLRRSGGGQWYPNYTLHLFGSGVTYVRLIDWYADHGFTSHPQIAAGATTFAYHLLVEAMENGPTADRGVDALSDLLVFDPASIVLWNQGWMRRLFSGPVEVTDWYGQTSVGLPGKTIENAYSMVVVRAPLPRATDWKVTLTHGYVFLLGLSRRVGANDWVTAGAGADAPVNPVIDSTTETRSATLERNFGVFYDRNGSLLASLVTRGGEDNGLTFNVFPGVLNLGPLRPSFWVQQNKGGGARFGISSSLGLGVSSHAGIRAR